MGGRSDTSCKFPMSGWRPWGTANTFVSTNRNDFKWPVPVVGMCGHAPKTSKYACAERPDLDCRNLCRLQASYEPQYYEVAAGGKGFSAPAGMLCVEVPDECVGLQKAARPPLMLTPRSCKMELPDLPTKTKPSAKCQIPVSISEYQDQYGRKACVTWKLMESGALRPEHCGARPVEPAPPAPPDKECETSDEAKLVKYGCLPRNFISEGVPCQSLDDWRIAPYSLWPEKGNSSVDECHRPCDRQPDVCPPEAVS